MKLLKTHIHEALENLEGNCEKRIAARGVILKNRKILLMYTNRYNDFSLPGGGIDLNESLSEGLTRELEEETGARNIQIEEEIGVYEEYRPCNKNGFQLLHILSYIYKVNCNDEFVECKFESYEIKNGMEKVWLDIDDAINHNAKVIDNLESSMGLSIRRELFLLQTIKEKYFADFN